MKNEDYFLDGYTTFQVVKFRKANCRMQIKMIIRLLKRLAFLNREILAIVSFNSLFFRNFVFTTWQIVQFFGFSCKIDPVVFPLFRESCGGCKSSSDFAEFFAAEFLICRKNGMIRSLKHFKETPKCR